MKKFTPLAVSLLFLSIPAIAQDWNQHRQSVLAQPSLIRYHLFDGTTTLPNLAPTKDVADSNLVYRTQRPFEAVDGPFAGTKAVRLDAGYFEGPKLGIDRDFTVEMRVRLHGIGSERGNNGTENGTLFGLGNGWDSGIRLTTDCPRQTLTFSIGRPTNPMSRNAYSGQPVPYGVWMHVTTTWDGKTMRIYVDGVLYTILDFEGVLTEPGWGFRVGFNGAGVGSVNMDVAEVAVYKTALPPEEVLAHALLQPKLPAPHAELLHAAIDAVLHRNFAEAEANIDKILALDMPTVSRFALRKFRADIAALSGNLTQSLRLSASLLAEPDLPASFAEGLLRRLIPTEYLNPLPVASSAIYKRILDDPSFDLTARQRFAIEKNYAGALFAESLSADGQHAEAKQLLAGLTERERAFNREDLERQNLSAELSELYKEKRNEHDRRIDNSAYLSSLRRGAPMSHIDNIAMLYPSETARRWPHITATFFVAPDGKAENPGTEAEPFGSLTQARDAIRKLRASTEPPARPERTEVIVRGGVYPVTETFVLEMQDSGSPQGWLGAPQSSPPAWIINSAPRPHIELVIYRAADGEIPIFTGGVTLPEFKKVDDPNILRRLPEEARDKVLVAQLPADIVFPPAAPRGYGRNGLNAAPAVEFFIDDVPQQIARWPNAPCPGAENVLEASENSFVRTGKVHRGANRGFLDESEAHLPGIFEYSDPRHERWLEAKDAMMYGYWGHLWSPASTLIERIDPQTKQVIMAT
ncbi:MAG: LamG domain-containing protein, partial [Planctomycetaceae bacterium]|nr:LamG domain-containing protein [Planctomycetaceae bacterium]